VWQAWYLVTSTSALRGRRGTFGTGLALVARFFASVFWLRSSMQARRCFRLLDLLQTRSEGRWFGQSVHVLDLLKLRCVCLQNLSLFRWEDISIVHVHAIFGLSAANAFASLKDVEMIYAVVQPFLPMCCSYAFRSRQGHFHLIR
jgi:hypothetical protein